MSLTKFVQGIPLHAEYLDTWIEIFWNSLVKNPKTLEFRYKVCGNVLLFTTKLIQILAVWSKQAPPKI